MSAQNPVTNPEKKEILDDNARKFTTEAIAHQFLEENDALSCSLITDWLETGEANERKLAYKEFDNGEIQLLHIAKVTKDGSRTSEKKKISAEEYAELLNSSILRLEKKRYEFTYTQNNTPFSVKYDEFIGSALHILEVDASSEEERNRFSPHDFPTKLVEVTGDRRYYGSRVGSLL